MSEIALVATDKAAKAAGPYSQAVVHNKVVYVSGCIGLTADTSTLVEGGPLAEAAQAFSNMEAILKEAGSSMDRVLKVTVYLTKIADFGPINELYAARFKDHKPARSCLAAAELPKGASFEIDCIAAL